MTEAQKKLHDEVLKRNRQKSEPAFCQFCKQTHLPGIWCPAIATDDPKLVATGKRP